MNQLELGKKIQDLRKLNGLTQEELAFRTGLSTRTIQRIENGEVDARTYTLNRLAEALNIELDVLLVENGKVKLFGDESSEKATKKWLALFHLSGLFILIVPPLLFWIIKKDLIPDINNHAKDILNFQISITIYLITSVFLIILIIGIPLLIFIAVFSSIIIVINSIKVLQGKSYRYPFNLNIIKNI